MIAGSRAYHSSSHAELYTDRVAEAGLYRIRTRVFAERGPVTYRIAARHGPPVGVVWGVKGSRQLALLDAKPGEFTDVEIEAFVNKGERVCVQKISVPDRSATITSAGSRRRASLRERRELFSGSIRLKPLVR